MCDTPPEISQTEALETENEMPAAGGSVTLTTMNGRLACVALVPLQQVVEQLLGGAPGPISHLLPGVDALSGIALMTMTAPLPPRRARPPGHRSSGHCSVDVLLRYSALREIRQLEATRGLSLQRRIPAIALTGYGQTENRVRALSTGFQLHMTEPAAITELIASIRKLAGRDRDS